MTDETSDPPRLRETLDALAARARRHLARWAFDRDLRLACRTALWWLLPGPALIVLASLVVARALPFWIWAAAALAGPVLFIAARLIWLAPGRRFDRRTSLAAFDTQLDSKDRLVTADEFLAAPLDPSAPMDRFKQAAIDDAAPCLQQALGTPLQPMPLPAWCVTPRSWLSMPAVAAMMLAALWLGGLAVPGAAAPDADRAGGAATAARADRAASRFDPPPPRPRVDRAAPVPQPDAAEPAASTDASPRSMRSEQDTEGVSHAGGRTSSRSISNAMSSSGTPSNQQMSSNPLEDDLPQDQKPAPLHAAKKPELRKPEPQATSATSGQGQSKSSSSDTNRIPATDRPDRAGMEKDDGKDEGAVQDQEEEEKTTGVDRPSLRKNKPPVDRNLSPRPAGDEPNPDANGRSGPGGRKKTRGVPAMILGIPTPDRIQGTSNPGRSKVTQEHSTPREEPQPGLAAEARLPRASAFGSIEHPLLLPWMQDLVEKYFLQLREKR